MNRNELKCEKCGDPWFGRWCRCRTDDGLLDRQMQSVMGGMSALLCRARSMADESHHFDIQRGCRACVKIMREFDDDLIGVALILVDGTIQHLAKNDYIGPKLMSNESLYQECCNMVLGFLKEKGDDITAADKLSRKDA